MDGSLHEEPASASAGSTSPLPAAAAENMSAESTKKVARQDGPPVNARQALKARMEALESDAAAAPIDSETQSTSGARTTF
jgi:hypothetical protein